MIIVPQPPLMKQQGAKWRADGAISGEATERPMESETFWAFFCAFAVLIFRGRYWMLRKRRDTGAGMCYNRNAFHPTTGKDRT